MQIVSQGRIDTQHIQKEDDVDENQIFLVVTTTEFV